MKLLGKRLLLIFVPILIGLILCEVVSRSLLRTYADAQFNDEVGVGQDFYRLSETRGYEILPRVNEEINGLGMRDKARTVEKPDGVFRVMALGDSIAFGAGVAPGETFSARLEELLHRRYEGRTFEVLNAGVIGYNTEQELQYLKDTADTLEPDAVVLAYCPNDIFVTPMVFKEGNKFRFYRPGNEKALYSAFLVRHSAFYRLLMFHYERMKAEREGTYREAAGIGENLNVDAEGNYDALRELAAYTKERELPLLVVIFPYMHGPFSEYDTRHRKIHWEVRRILKEADIACVDLLLHWHNIDYRDFLREDAPTDFVHPNAAGHLSAAEHMLSWIVDQELVPR